ncbi:nucleic acid-binding protein [Hesseltinella vesiculosa]|uniref:Nucleic acid-binding protein n=1 Tax=Hesseltinella vesiculosa TaxID=101127 RepID=A0A1X2GCK0_9FUNG|nr:nucleic acid-binding protein [Hesseltinella vesiculosa]
MLRTIPRWRSASRFYSTTAVTTDDLFHRLHLKVGTITNVQPHPEADHLYIEKLDVGEPEERTIVSGLAKFMPMTDLQGKKVVVVANMKPSRFRGVLSQGMLMAAANAEGTKVDLLTVSSESANGDRVVLSSVEPHGEPDGTLKPKQKVFEQIAPFLRTDAQGVATYKGVPLATAQGIVQSTKIPNGQIS